MRFRPSPLFPPCLPPPQMAQQIDRVQRVLKELEGSAGSRFVVRQGGKEVDEDRASTPLARKEPEPEGPAIKENWVKVRGSGSVARVDVARRCCSRTPPSALRRRPPPPSLLRPTRRECLRRDHLDP